MDPYQPLKWAVIGALTLIIVNVAFSWFATAPDHNEWTDSAVFPIPFLAVVGGAIGGLAGTYRRSVLRRRSEQEKDKHL